MLKTETENESILRGDDNILETDTELTGLEPEDDPVQDFNKTKDLELVRVLEEAYMTPPQTDDENDESACIFFIPF
jgi:hypothetical protein